MIYKLVDKFLMNDFTPIISEIINKQNKIDINVFDIGCFQGNFSRNLREHIKIKTNFFLFDANPNLDIKDFEYTKLAFSNEKGMRDFHLNTFFPASGSSLKKIISEDKLWNFTWKLITGNLGKKFETFKVQSDTLDNYCKDNKIEKIDILKIDTEGSELDILLGAKNILKNTDVVLVEVMDKKKEFKDKYNNVMEILTKNNKFQKVFEKNIWSLGTLSGSSATDILFKK